MYSGKTTELFRRFVRYKLAGKKCILVKYNNDTRYSNTNLVTHDNNKLKAIKCIKLENIYEQIK